MSDQIEQMIARNARDLERAFQMLEMAGIPRTRAKTVAGGISVLIARMQREIADQAVRIAELEAELGGHQ